MAAARSKVTESLGAIYAPYYTIRFEKWEDKKICVIEVEHSPEPVFMKSGGTKEFFVRVNNTTRPLDVEETHRYIRMKWPPGEIGITRSSGDSILI